MTQVFVSYCREDEAKAAKVVKGLLAAGCTVWWDKGLPGGADWRAEIERQLEIADVVVVCWSKFSAGPRGGFVRDEASRSGSRLLPVFLERVRPPLGFGETQGLDLAGWSGNAQAPAFRDLVAAVVAKAAGEPPPKPRAPGLKALRSFFWSSGVSTLVIAVALIALTVPAVKEGMCHLPIAQPSLSQACCSAGLTNKTLARAKDFTPAPTTKLGYVRQSEVTLLSELAAQQATAARVNTDATALCQPTTEEQRLRSVKTEIGRFECHQVESGFTCGVEYKAYCELEERRLIETCEAEAVR